jgi:hypothetical protein
MSMACLPMSNSDALRGAAFGSREAVGEGEGDRLGMDVGRAVAEGSYVAAREGGLPDALLVVAVLAAAVGADSDLVAPVGTAAASTLAPGDDPGRPSRS